MPDSKTDVAAIATPTGPGTPEEARAAARALHEAIDRHLAAVESRTGEADPAVQEAFDELQAAAETYDDLLFETYDEVTPFEFGPPDVDPEGVLDLDLEGGSGVAAVSLFLRRDYGVREPGALLEAARTARRELAEEGLDGDSPDGSAGQVDGDGADDEPMHLGTALYELLHLTGVDGLDDTAEDVGLDPLGGTVWFLAAGSADLPDRPDDNPFRDVDVDRLIFRVNEVVGD